MKKIFFVCLLPFFFLGAGCGGSSSEKATNGFMGYRKVHITGPVQAKIDEATVDGQTVACVAQGEYDITVWFSGDPKAVNAFGVFDPLKQDAKIKITGYDCQGYGGAIDQCMEYVSGGSKTFPFQLKEGTDFLFLSVDETGTERIKFEAQQPTDVHDVQIHYVCPSTQSDGSDWGTSYSQLVFPLVASSTNPAFNLTVGFDASTVTPVHFSNRSSVGKVWADIDLSVYEIMTITLGE